MPGIVVAVSLRSSDECMASVRTMSGALRRDGESVNHISVPELGVYAGWTGVNRSRAEPDAMSKREDVTVLMAGEVFCEDGQASSLRSGQAPSADDLAGLYRRQGIEFIASLNGLFSGLLVDRLGGRAFLFNDRFGMERLYYLERDRSIYFASEAKALLQVFPEHRAFDDLGVAQVLNYGCTLGDRTLFDGIRVLDGATVWSFEAGGAHSRHRYFDPSSWESQETLEPEPFAALLADRFPAILAPYLRGDNRVGVSLTGGFDTRMIMATLGHLRVRPICYTFSGFTERTLDERLAARVAAEAGLEHHVLRLAPDFLSRFDHWVDRTVYLSDACAGATTSHEIYLNALARALSNVRVTGNFGSEVLRGMSTFKPLGLACELVSPEFRGSLALAAREGQLAAQNPVTQAAFNEIPRQLFGTWCAARTQLTVRTPYLDNELVRIAYQSPAASRQSPAAAIHVVNTHDARMGRIATDRGYTFRRRDPFRWARRSVEYAAFKLDYWHQEGLPRRVAFLDPALEKLGRAGVFGRHKYLPYRRWFRRDLARYVAEVLQDDATMRMPYWNHAFLRSAPAQHASGHRNLVREINAVLQLDAARRVLLNPAPVSSLSPVPVANA